jgi:hypothetical protein
LWIFSEQEPKQDYDSNDEGTEHYVPIVPPTGRQELLIPDDLAPTETITVVFKNELVTGCFIVRKFGEIPATTAPVTQLGSEFNVAGWGFQLLRKDGTVARQGVTDARGEIRFDNLPLGPYTIVEEDRPGWDEVTAREVEFNVQGNNCDGDPTDTVVEFRNTQDDSGFCIEGRKVDANGGYGIPGWEITIEALDEGGALPVDDVDASSPVDVDSTTTDGLGEFRFDFLRNDYRVPGGLYEVCESAQDGWLAHTPTCQVVRLPEWPGACVQLSDFVNQQVGHSESEHQYDKGNDYGKGDYGKGDSGYPSGQNGNQGYPGGNNSQYPSGQYGQQGNAQCSTYHVVQAGEGLYEIGRAYQKTPQQMLDANPDVRDGDELWVYEGQRICIP